MHKILLSFMPRKTSASKTSRQCPAHLRLRTGIKAGPKCPGSCKVFTSEQG